MIPPHSQALERGISISAQIQNTAIPARTMATMEENGRQSTTHSTSASMECQRCLWNVARAQKAAQTIPFRKGSRIGAPAKKILSGYSA